MRTLLLYFGRSLFVFGGLMVIGGIGFMVEPYFFMAFPNNVVYGFVLFFMGASLGGLGRLLQWSIHDNWPEWDSSKNGDLENGEDEFSERNESNGRVA